MFKKFLIFATLFTASTSMAVEVTCQFTEPFVTVKYQTLSGQMEVIAPHFGPIPRIDNLRDAVVNSDKSSFQLNVVDSSNQTLLQIIPDGRGSDGMSNRVFPYTAVLTLPNSYASDTHLHSPLRGGCETELRRATKN